MPDQSFEPDPVASLCQLFADHFSPRGVEVVAAPAIGGVALAHNRYRDFTTQSGEYSTAINAPAFAVGLGLRANLISQFRSA